MKLNRLMEIRRVLLGHANESIPTVLAYKIMKFLKASDDEGAFFEQKLKEIIDEYGIKDENGQCVHIEGQAKIKPESIEKCKKAIDVLGKTDVEAPNIAFTIGDLTSICLTVSELYSLDEIITEE